MKNVANSVFWITKIQKVCCSGIYKKKHFYSWGKVHEISVGGPWFIIVGRSIQIVAIIFRI